MYFEDEGRDHKESRQPVEDEEGKETIVPSNTPKGTSPGSALTLAQGNSFLTARE
jgi:hypothetical protein